MDAIKFSPGLPALILAVNVGLWGASTPGGQAADPPLDYKEIRTLIQSQLQDLDPARLDTAAAKGLISSLHPRVRLVADDALSTPDNPGPPKVARKTLDQHYAYLRIDRFAPGTGEDAASALDSIAKEERLKGLVLDLRFAAGDHYAAAAEIADRFFDAETDLMDWGQGTRKSTSKTNAIQLPLALLVNRETAEGAEALAGILRAAGAGLLIGSNTAGQASMYREFELSTGQKLHIATQPVLIANQKSIAAEGLDPDIRVDAPADRERAWIEDPYKVFGKPGAPALAGAEDGASSTNQTGRRRLNEADLVRMLREGELPDGPGSGGERPPSRPMIQDPVLNRALDFLKGLALVRSISNP